MALIKKISTEFGVDATYWNIGAYQEDFKNGGAEITLYGYASEDARREGKQPLVAGKTYLKKEDGYAPDLTRAEIYEKLKATEAWKDAIAA